MHTLTVVEFTTFFRIPKINGINYRDLRIYMSTINFNTREYEPFGYIEDDLSIRIPKIPHGMLINTLCKLYNVKDVVINKADSFPYDKIEGYYMKNQPKDDIQKSVIDGAIKNLAQEERCIISLKTGQGKTYVAVNIIHRIKVRTIIFVKSVELKNQWYEAFMNHTTAKNIITINAVADLVALNDASHKFDVIITTHRSMQLFIDTIGLKEFSKFMIKKGIGLKIYDEFDLENASMFKIDTHSSTRFNLYLSATDYKSGSHEQRIFQRIFQDVPNIGKEFLPDIKRNAIFCLYKSNPTKREKYSTLMYTREGPVFNYHKYHAYMVEKKAYILILTKMWQSFIKERYYSHVILKTVFFIGRKTTAEDFKKDLLKITGLDAEYISILNSDTPTKDREKAMNSRLIISTSDSLGRGIDLKGLDTVVDLETRASLSETVQVLGRVSRTGMKNVGTYIQLIDADFSTVLKNYEKKMEKRFFDTYFTDIKIKEFY